MYTIPLWSRGETEDLELGEINVLRIDHQFLEERESDFSLFAWFFDKYIMKNNLQNKMQIAHFFMASKNIDMDNVCHVIVYR